MQFQSTKRSRFLRACLIAVVAAGAAQAQAKLDTTTFVVLGEGLAAGMANYGLNSTFQTRNFPAVMATQMNTAFPQPLIQPPGIGDVIGYPQREVITPTLPQGTVRVFPEQPNPNDNAPPVFVLNLSVPGHKLVDAINLRPVAPIVQKDMKQTVVNMILGFPQLFFQRTVPLWSQTEYAKAMFPTMALVELGYYEALEAAVAGDPTKIPDPVAWGQSYAQVVQSLRQLQAQVIVTTIPNPIETAYFANPRVAASIVATAPFILTAGYQLTQNDYITRKGMEVIATQFWNRTIGPLPAGSILRANVAADITNRVNALNAQIVNAAKANGAVVYDLNAFLHKIYVTGVTVGTRSINADYFGGFYSLDAVYPGPTGHALIANDILAFLNQTYKTSFSLVDAKTVAAGDPVFAYQKPGNGRYSGQQLRVTDGPADLLLEAEAAAAQEAAAEAAAESAADAPVDTSAEANLDEPAVDAAADAAPNPTEYTVTDSGTAAE
ncbi:MAG: hypothetical protein ABL967_07515 [Bryobacteraceae bacterium]